MRKTTDREIKWVKMFTNYNIDTDKVPFKTIKQQPWAGKCTPEFAEEGKDFITPETQPDHLYIVGKGLIGIGDYEKVGRSRDFCVEKLTVGYGSILLEVETPMEIDGRKYMGILPQQRAWATSELLSKVIAYTLNERKRFAEKAILLRIPSECLQDFLNVAELKTHMYRNALHKSKQYWLLPKEIEYEVGNDGEIKEQSIRKGELMAKRIEALWKHCINNKRDSDKKLYILSVARMDALLGIKGGYTRPDKKRPERESSRIETEFRKLERIVHRRGELQTESLFISLEILKTLLKRTQGYDNIISTISETKSALEKSRQVSEFTLRQVEQILELMKGYGLITIPEIEAKKYLKECKLSRVGREDLPNHFREFYDFAYPPGRGNRPLPYKIEDISSD